MIVDVLGFEASKSQCPLVTIHSKTKMTQLEHARIISVWAVARGGGGHCFLWHFQIGQYNQIDISPGLVHHFNRTTPEFPPCSPAPSLRLNADSLGSCWGSKGYLFFRVNFTNMTTNGKETYQKLYLYNFYSCLENNNNKLLV